MAANNHWKKKIHKQEFTSRPLVAQSIEFQGGGFHK